MSGSFQQPKAVLELGWQRLPDGLRTAQLGAICGLGAHFAVHPSEVAQVVLPTGVGKTLVLTAVPYLLRAERVLVVAPSRVLRDQLAKAFASLSDLKDSGVLPSDTPAPRVKLVSKRMADADDWRAVADFDIVVGTVHALSSGYGAAPVPVEATFDLALFDEAHHLPAATWTTLLRELPAATRSVAATATPFRRDRRRIPGRVAFNYPLSQAMADGVYAPVEFVAVDADPEDQAAADFAIARRATELLREDVHTAAGSQLLVRTDRVEHAERLEKLYRESFDLPVRLITEKTSARAMQKILDELDADDADARGLVCVGALIEGFNRPRLKVAAYHSPHQSLAPTLQFIGRLARVGSDAPAQLVAVPAAVTGEARDLYEEDRAWSAVIPQLVDAEIGEQQTVRDLADRAVTAGSREIPVESLTPARSARIYSLPEGLVPALDAAIEQMEGRTVIREIYDADLALRCMVTRRVVRPRWMRSEVLDGPEYECHVACWVAEHRLLFVATEHGGVNRLLLGKLGVEELASPLAEHEIARLLLRQNVDRYFSVGARETAPARLASTTYEMAAGGHVDAGLDPVRARGQRLGHAMGRGRSEGSFGLSVKKSKWWEPKPTRSLVEFVAWCRECAADLAGPDAGNLAGLPYAMSRPLQAFPDALPLALVPDAELLGWSYVGAQRFAIIASEWACRRIDDTQLEVEIIREATTRWVGRLDLRGRASRVSGDGKFVDDNGEVHEIHNALTDHPPTIVFGDGTSVIGAGLALPPSTELGALPSGVLQPRDWTGTDIHAEFAGAEPGLNTIFETVVEWLAGPDFGAPFVLCDHDTGELADFIALRPSATTCKVDLVHCKALRRGEPVRTQMVDIEEVLQQSARSSRWNVPGRALWSDLIARRARNRTSVEHGDEAACDALLAGFQVSPPVVELTVHAVHPGVAGARVAGWVNGCTLIHVTLNWIRQLEGNFVFHSNL